MSEAIAPMHDVLGRVAFITGGASGIGLGIARAFAEAGMKVVIGDINQDHITHAMKCLKSVGKFVHSIRVDVTDRVSMARAAEETQDTFGSIHVLVNNAGVQNPSALSNMSYAEWDTMIGVNLGAVFNGVHTFLPYIKKHGNGGHIVTTASMFGLFTWGAGYAAYCASKFGAVALMESLRAELRAVGIGVSVLCPGPVKSNLESFLKDYSEALDPLVVGRAVLRGIERNDLYLLTHPEFTPIIQCRTDAIVASNPKDIHPSEERNTLARSALETSIYLTERNRHLMSDHERMT